MTLTAGKEFKYTRYTYAEVFSLLIGRARRTGVSVLHAAPTQGRRVTVHVDITVESKNEKGERKKERMVGDRVAVVLGRSSDWYRHRLNVYAEFEGVQWVVCGTHDSCLSIPVWSVEEERLYEAHETRIPFSDLLTNTRLRHTEFGHKLLLGGMMCNLPEARQVAAELKRTARFQIERDVRMHTHRRRGQQLKISAEDAIA